MRVRQKLHIAMLLTTKALISFMLLVITGGCGVIGVHEKFGQPYNFDNSPKVRPGMTQEQVITLLGKPYVMGLKQNGDIVLQYQWTEKKGQSFVFGLFFIMGEKQTVAVSGGGASIILAPETKTVKTIEYTIVGSANYDRLRGGNNDSAH